MSRPGVVSYSDSLFNVYNSTSFASNVPFAFVSMNGNDTTGKLNSSANPFRTIQHALRSTSAQKIYVEPGTYDPSDFVLTDTGGSTPKMVFCQVRDTCTIAVTGGVDISSSDWSPSTYPGIYQTPINSDGVTTGAIQRLLLTDSSDYDGFPSRLPLFSSLQALSTAATGWFYDHTAKILYAGRAGMDLSAQHKDLEALYLGKSGLARQLISGTTVLFEGFYFNGVSLDDVEYGPVNGVYTPSNLWVTDSKIVFGNEFGVWVIGSNTYVASTLIHANHDDGMNGNWSRAGAAGHPGVMFAANTMSTAAGDYETFGTALAPDNNSYSSHDGYFICFACIGGDSNYGPDFADSSSTLNVPSKTWLVAPATGRMLPSNTLDYGGYQWGGCTTCSSDDPRNREVWIETAESLSEGGKDFVANYHAHVHMFNMFTTTAMSGYLMYPADSYVPNNP